MQFYIKISDRKNAIERSENSGGKFICKRVETNRTVARSPASAICWQNPKLNHLSRVWVGKGEGMEGAILEQDKCIFSSIVLSFHILFIFFRAGYVVLLITFIYQ